MNDDELKKLWQQQPLREPAPSAAQLISAMQKQTSQFRRILDARDLRELVACAFVMIVFGCFAFFLHAHQPISRLGDWIVIASSIFIAGKLIHTRRTTPSAPPGATIVESLRAELNSVRAQSRLLGSVLWWYLLPILAGALVMTWGSLPINDPVALLVMIPANIVVTLVFIGVNVFIYRLNQRARGQQLLPLEAQLESLLHSAETGEPLDETQIADLRPIALSVAAADEVEPVEFKVAFWQIALWGEMGFIGIWFFLMVALTIHFQPAVQDSPNFISFVLRIFSPLHLALMVPFFLAGLLFSRLLQKLTERAVGISTLGIHLYNGQNLLLWGEIKDVRPIRTLNIRHLWLIRESGEKTLIPWTSLERRSDLKAAVERFAPANHPLRKYLSLLRRSPRLTSNRFLIPAVESEKEGRLVNAFENPYPSRSSEEPAPDAFPSGSDKNADPRQIGKAKHIPTVAVLMIVHGVLMFVAGSLLIGVMVLLTSQLGQIIEDQQQLQRQQNPNTPQITREAWTAFLNVTYGTMTACLFLIGVLNIYAGARNYGYRNRDLGVISLFANLGSILCCWCLPLSIGLLIYGMIIYQSPEADRAFRWRSRHPPQL